MPAVGATAPCKGTLIGAEVNVFVTSREDFQTKTVQLASDQISEILDSDPFFNLDNFTGRGDE